MCFKVKFTYKLKKKICHDSDENIGFYVFVSQILIRGYP